jgi:hypothetical protein
LSDGFAYGHHATTLSGQLQHADPSRTVTQRSREAYAAIGVPTDLKASTPDDEWASRYGDPTRGLAQAKPVALPEQRRRSRLSRALRQRAGGRSVRRRASCACVFPANR